MINCLGQASGLLKIRQVPSFDWYVVGDTRSSFLTISCTLSLLCVQVHVNKYNIHAYIHTYMHFLPLIQVWMWGSKSKQRIPDLFHPGQLPSSCIKQIIYVLPFMELICLHIILTTCVLSSRNHAHKEAIILARVSKLNFAFSNQPDFWPFGGQSTKRGG